MDSDWSDDELEELERVLVDFQERSGVTQQQQKKCMGKPTAEERWRKLKQSRRIIMQKVNE